MPALATFARQLVLVLLATSGMIVEGARTPVFRGTMGMGGRTTALFEVQGNQGTWQGEVGRTLPGTRWTIQAIDQASGTVTIRVAGAAPVTLHQGETYAAARVATAPEPARAPGPLSRAPASAPPPAPTRPAAVPVVRALDASASVPPLSSLPRPGSTTVVMLLGADPEQQALKVRVLGLVRREKTAVVFVHAGPGAAPVLTAWNAGPLPHFIVMDPGGRVIAAGPTARALVDGWLAAPR